MDAPQGSSHDCCLRADYADSEGTTTFTEPVGILRTPHSVQDKTAYLSKLRSSVIKLQDDVNAFLTQKMELEKRRQGPNVKAVEDLTAEANYGEEVVDES